MDRWRTFIKKYDFPVHLLVVLDIAVAWLSTLLWTLKAKILFRLLGCAYGQKLQVDGNLTIRVARRGTISLGESVKINSRFGANLVGKTTRTVFQCLGDGKIHLGDNTGCSFAVLSSMSLIQVGNQVRIGGNVRIYDHDYHSLDYLVRRDARRDRLAINTRPVVIGDDVLIGANAIILKGVHVGARSIIGAGAVVTLKEIPPDSVVAGNPARVVRTGNSGPSD